ncbi:MULTISPECIES: response regulator [unclassified Siphonobacter]|uniref:response regulator n=1 Tax=unclassified Siphonobacter TaxID=2635712 RepID=UPI000CC24F4B|nr:MULTISPECIES: response regulator [unclassified Siphonobacter]MDQ1088215.1 CheY-like chemotaxis protein [Siphonobacter sp. SORGH_AS_1065]MDR6194360.1 CheY-like chemotaxis protein [Siphonobacter sp. SORGH_AS_0500]PKK37662.1 histidine kinase [Siphonobacter sp. SORGH_AS_0500]
MAFKRVLIAEDSSVIQNLAKKILEFQNFEITSVKNGEQVLQLLEKENYDVVLLDINMPVMDGMECARQIRKLPDANKAKTPILAITGNARNYSPEEFKSAGFDDILIKPLNFDALVAKVREYTGGVVE